MPLAKEISRKSTAEEVAAEALAVTEFDGFKDSELSIRVSGVPKKQVAEGIHHVPGLVEEQVHSMNEVWEVLQTGSSARAVGSTNANGHSSRSHCILCVMVRGENLIDGEAFGALILQNGNSEKAMELFCQMQQRGAKPNQFTFANFLGACGTLASLKRGSRRIPK
eukprot:Gb_17943 [translate_table: standard]